MVLVRALVALLLVSASARAAADPGSPDAVTPLASPAAAVAAPTLPPAAPLDAPTEAAPPALTTAPPPPAQPRRPTHTLLWLWGGLGVALIATIAVTAQERTTPHPFYGNSGFDRTFP